MSRHKKKVNSVKTKSVKQQARRQNDMLLDMGQHARNATGYVQLEPKGLGPRPLAKLTNISNARQTKTNPGKVTFKVEHI